ncbi:hypothetical protein QG37_02314 [Candidozyma auris]|uniref:Uncharacterized protein n=1 Tax=Candidozyma auris TaxID=498019 RepID=A0A0L0P310_CANAR|nr:hypothetical protein QG37_02314 [[Candida] auris]
MKIDEEVGTLSVSDDFCKKKKKKKKLQSQIITYAGFQYTSTFLYSSSLLLITKIHNSKAIA